MNCPCQTGVVHLYKGYKGRDSMHAVSTEFICGYRYKCNKTLVIRLVRETRTRTVETACMLSLLRHTNCINGFLPIRILDFRGMIPGCRNTISKITKGMLASTIVSTQIPANVFTLAVAGLLL